MDIGTSGWSYPTGAGTWNGIFYPRRRGRGFDELTYYAERFNSVEVNSTFYRPPEPALAEGWLRRTPASFTFAVKLYQKFTHPDMYLKKAKGQDWDVTVDDLDQFRRGIDPLARADRLVALLLQFPASFHALPETREYLDWLLTAFAGYPLAVELRHRTWLEGWEETTQQLTARRAVLTLSDDPTSSGELEVSTRNAQAERLAQPLAPGETALVYVRLHGRNFATWWHHDNADDRYDYLYSAGELETFAGVARNASKAGRRVAMYLNNHYSAKAAANATVLKHQLAEPITGEFPREMVERYPELAELVSTGGLPI